ELPEHELRPGDGGAGAGGGGGGSLSRGRRPQGRGGRGGGGSLSRGRRRLVGVARAVTVLVAADGDDVGDPEVEHEGFITHRIEEDVVLDFGRSEEHTSELQSRFDLVCRLLLEKKKD